MGTSYSLPTFEFMMQYSIENDDLPQPAHRFILNGAKPPRNFFRIYPSRDSMSIQTGQLTFEYYKSGNFHVEKMLVCYIFVFVSFMSLSMLTKLNTLKHIKAATPCFSSFAQNAMLLQLQLVRTVLTSSNALSCLLHLLITSAIALADMVEDCDPLGFRRSQCR